ncbi:MAG: hypothetical protein ACR2H4_01495 [Pyrinomonadaceae bacterium]
MSDNFSSLSRVTTSYKAYRTPTTVVVRCAVTHFIGIITVSDDRRIGDKQNANII